MHLPILNIDWFVDRHLLLHHHWYCSHFPSSSFSQKIPGKCQHFFSYWLFILLWDKISIKTLVSSYRLPAANVFLFPVMTIACCNFQKMFHTRNKSNHSPVESGPELLGLGAHPPSLSTYYIYVTIQTGTLERQDLPQSHTVVPCAYSYHVEEKY